jgi:hypothetical protein
MAVNSRVRSLVVSLTLVWLCLIAVRYLLTVLKSIQQPYAAGDDIIWVLGWFGTAILIIGSLAIHRKIAFGIWSTAIVATVIVMLFLSGTAVDAGIGIWTMVVATLVGDSALSLLKIFPTSFDSTRLVIATSLGIVVLALVSLVLASVHQLTSVSAWTVLIALSVVEVKPALTRFRKWREQNSKRPIWDIDLEFGVLTLLPAVVFGLNLTWSLAPETSYDALNYHLAVPKIYLAHRGLVDLPYFFHSYFAHLVEMLFAFCMALHGQMVAKFVMALIALITMLGVYALGAMIFTSAVGLWAAALFSTMPLTSWMVGTAYTDLAVALFLLASTIAFLCWSGTDRAAWLLIAGILAGSGVAVKLNAMYAAIGMLLALGGWLVFKPESKGKRVRTVAVFVIAAGLLAAPWFALAYIHTGNPIFPLMNGFFKSPKAEFSNTIMNAAGFGIGSNVTQLLRLPFRITFESSRFNEALPRGGLGPILLLFVPFGLLLMFVKNPEARTLGVISGVYLILWAKTFQYGRYYLVILPFLAILGIAGLRFAARTPLAEAVSRIVLLTLLISQVALLPIFFWNLPDRFPVALAFGSESREYFLGRVLGGYAGVVHINRNISPGYKVLGVNTENLRFYLDPPLETLSESLLDSPLRRVSDIPPGPELARALSDLKFSYLLIYRDVLTNPAPEYPYASKQFLSKFTVLEYSNEAIAVYRVKPGM